MQPEDVLKHVDAEAIARDTLAFVEVKSETCTEGPGSEFLAELFRREGFEVERDDVEPGRPLAEGFCVARVGGSTDCVAHLVLRCSTVARRFCLQNRARRRCFCFRLSGNFDHRHAHNLQSGDQSIDSGSGEGTEI